MTSERLKTSKDSCIADKDQEDEDENPEYLATSGVAIVKTINLYRSTLPIYYHYHDS